MVIPLGMIHHHGLVSVTVNHPSHVKGIAVALVLQGREEEESTITIVTSSVIPCSGASRHYVNLYRVHFSQR
jgi:hypothetical protein